MLSKYLYHTCLMLSQDGIVPIRSISYQECKVLFEANCARVFYSIRIAGLALFFY